MISYAYPAPVALFLLFASAASANDLPLHGKTVLHFASKQQSADVLGSRDRFVRAMSRFDRQVRLETDADVSEAQVLDFFRQQALSWSDEQIERLTPVVEAVRKRLDQLRVPLPDTVLLVHASDKVETGYAHCRENAIVIPLHVLRRSPPQLERLLVHELFHVISSHNRDLRRELYRGIGFTLCDEIEMPAMLADRKITNPDAPMVDCFIKVDVNGQQLLGAPVIYSSEKTYDPNQKRKLMQYVTFRLMQVERKDDKLTPVLHDGQRAVVFDAKQLDSFYDQIGRNTNYIIHPDEILADNFVHLVMGDQNLATPRVVEGMAKLLGKQR